MLASWNRVRFLRGMAYETVVSEGFEAVITRHGRRAHIEKSARGIDDALVLLRLILAYCLGGKGLRLTAAWAASLGVAECSIGGCREVRRRLDRRGFRAGLPGA